MPPILTETIIRRQYRCSYYYSTALIVGGIVAFIYGMSTLPSTTQESSHEYTSSAEQKTEELRKYQMTSFGFKIAMAGLGTFIFGLFIYLVTLRKENKRLDEYEEALRKETNRKSRPSAKVYIKVSPVSAPAASTSATAPAVTAPAVTAPAVTASATAPTTSATASAPTTSATASAPSAKSATAPPIQYTVYHLQKQEQAHDKIRGKVYTGYFGHYPPNYRNYMEAHLKSAPV